MWILTRKVLRHDLTKPLCRLFRCKTIEFPNVTKSLEEKLQEEVKYDPELDFKVDIGLPPPAKISQAELKKRKKFLYSIKQNEELEKKSRNLLLNPDLDEIRAEWMKNEGPKQIQTIANHYQIYDHLFGDAYFTPYVMMNIHYWDKDNKLVTPVCRGNIVKPAEAFSPPDVKFDSNPEDLWTLTMVNPDGHFTEENMEYIHWFVGNIPGGNVKKGETIWDYLPPFPPRGVGYQRYVFILYKQDNKIDYSKLKKTLPCLELKDRSFKTLEFYRERQDYITPVGLSFFQSNWDKTARKVFHEILNMEEPVFEYDHEPLYYKEQEWFPKKQPFNLYLDRYRDPKDIAQEYLLKKLKDHNPLERPKKPFPYPKAVRCHFENKPSWLKTKEIRYRAGIGRVQNEMRDEYE